MAAQSFLPTISLLLFFLLLLTLSVSGHGGHHDEENDPDSSTTPPLSQHPHLRSKTLIIIKIFCLIIVFFGTFIGGVSPYFFKWNENFLVLGTQFAGGVFLGTALMHFLSDSNETFGDLTNKEYPFAFMLACAGYLLTMLADCVISYVYGSNQEDDGVKPNDLEIQGVVTQDKSKNGSGTTSSPSQLQVENRNDTHTHFGNPSFSSATSLGDSILLIVALCSHSVFEGIAIGVAETKADAWKALWTISLHKVFAAIAMGIALLRMIPNRPLLSCVAYAFAFAISTPIGVAIGIIIDATTQGVVADWIYAISMAIACGVFIYVSINHLLSKGYTPQGIASFNTQHYKFLAVALGIGVISVVMIWDT